MTQAQVYPGLYESAGTPHPIHEPNTLTGKTINVLDFGADPADNENDDRLAIEAALQTAVAGDELYFPIGIYNFNSAKSGDNSTHILPKSGVNWRGEKMSGTILKSAFGDVTIARFFKMRASHDILISTFTITSNFQGKYSTDVNVNNPDAGGPKYVISIEDDNGMPSYNITVDSVLIENYRVHGVRLGNSHDVVVKNSIFQKATDVAGGGAGYGVSIQGNKKQGNNSKFNVVENCQFLGPYIRHGVIMQYATHNNAVRYNDCNDNRLDAIDLHGEDEYLNEIYENTVRDVLKGAGIGVGNTGATHDRSGPYNYIHDNQFINCREGVKVYLGSPDTRIENNTITGSAVANGKGIYILNGPRTVVKGNRIYANSGSGFTGIYLQYDGGTNGKGDGPPQDIKILENRVYENPYGVRLYAGERIVYEDNDVHDNSVADYYASSGVTFHKLLSILIIGSGRVESDPAGDSFPEGATVSMTALPLANWRFDHWEGDVTGTENPLSVGMDQSKKITAVFVENPDADEVNLFVATIGSGKIALDPPSGVYQRGEVVHVLALPDSFWIFSGWSGDLNGASPVDSLIVDTDKSITAIFDKAQIYDIVTWVVGSGQIAMDPPGGRYVEGTSVLLTAIPEQGWQFKSWGGALSGSKNPDTVLVDDQKAVMVTFAKNTDVAKKGSVFNYSLNQNSPNPFNNSTEISFSLAQEGHATVQIFDVRGRHVATPVNEFLPRGQHKRIWSAPHLASGVYILRIESGSFMAMRKMILAQ